MRWFRVEHLLPFDPVTRESLVNGEEIWYSFQKSIHGPFTIVIKNGEIKIRNGQGVELPISKFSKVEFYRMCRNKIKK
jgi:hypothetical protein